MTPLLPGPDLPASAQAIEEASLRRHFDATEAIPLWIAEPYVPAASAVTEALADRAHLGWYGYETRPESLFEAFTEWMGARHGWTDLPPAVVSPSVGTSLGVLMELLTDPGDGVIIQPPVFTDFKPLVVAAGRRVVRNPLALVDGRYDLDLVGLEAVAAEPGTRLLILCNPHNPVGRVWSADELAAVADVCARHDVAVAADEIHGDLALGGRRWTPFADAAGDSRWASIHGPIKTFGLAGVCDTLLLSPDDAIIEGFSAASSRLHLTRNHVFGLAAFEAAYRAGGPWLDDLLDRVAANLTTLREGLPDGVRLTEPEGTYLAWLDLRDLGVEVPRLAAWLAAEAGIAVSPGHWFGREGAGFARLTVAAPADWIEAAAAGLRDAVAGLSRRPAP